MRATICGRIAFTRAAMRWRQRSSVASRLLRSAASALPSRSRSLFQARKARSSASRTLRRSSSAGTRISSTEKISGRFNRRSRVISPGRASWRCSLRHAARYARASASLTSTCKVRSGRPVRVMYTSILPRAACCCTSARNSLSHGKNSRGMLQRTSRPRWFTERISTVQRHGPLCTVARWAPTTPHAVTCVRGRASCPLR
ncbi:MAG: hypothetical protein KatS3mg015_3163 [Fimbriimonadales bacterium]|nr:MAG: hypothetical protein KatS3mg015_3163 [Fimbriimonadales bacterium]